ncbi:HET-domain-containing protein, partial [Bimuria novae-zelandiae CBS 107.79]
IALSYCWGKDPILATNLSNLQDFQESIAIKELPRTVRDAIIVTRRLRIRYLWVDVLCIVQGSDSFALSDWEKESAKMHHIYGGAILTLSAAHAVDANGGLFHQSSLEAQLLCTLSPGSKYSGRAILGLETPQFFIKQEPLNSRAWTLQESLLSSRVLSFGTSGLRWKCDQVLYHETTPNLQHHGSDLIGTETLITMKIMSGVVQERLSSKPKQILKEWKAILENYSQRRLTYDTDKLPAIAGLAQLVNRSCHDRYLAGLWKSDIAQQLMWIHRGRLTGNVIEYSRQMQFRAPSWSWASVNGRIQFP